MGPKKNIIQKVFGFYIKGENINHPKYVKK